MSDTKYGFPLAALFSLCGLGFALGIHHFSQQQTIDRMREVELQRSKAEDAQSRVRAAELENLHARAQEIVARRVRFEEAKKKGGASAAFALPGDPAKGRNSYMACAMCHGAQAEGKRAYYAPRLAGQEPWYIESQLRKFKGGVRGKDPRDIYGMQMAMASKMLYSAEMLDNVVAYIASIDAVQAVERGDGDAAAGRRHYAPCASCHGPRAQGNEERGAPMLAKQHAWYLQKQIENFLNGMRETHERAGEAQEMVDALRSLQEGDIADLIAYIQSHGD